MKKLDNKGYMDITSFITGGVFVIITILCLSYLSTGSIFPFSSEGDSEEIEITDVISWIQDQQKEVDKANSTITGLEEEIDNLKTTDWYTKYNALQQELDSVETKYIITTFVVCMSILTGSILVTIIYRKSIDKKLNKLNEKVSKIKKDTMGEERKRREKIEKDRRDIEEYNKRIEEIRRRIDSQDNSEGRVPPL